MNLQCFSKDHLSQAVPIGVLGILFIAAGPLILVGYLFRIVYRKTDGVWTYDVLRLREPEWAGKVLFVYHSYKDEFWYWEVLKVFE